MMFYDKFSVLEESWRKIMIYITLKLSTLLLLCFNIVQIDCTDSNGQLNVADAWIITPTNITPTEIAIHWEDPSNSIYASVFDVNINGPLQRSKETQINFSNQTTENQYHFKNLDPCGQYKITLQAISDDGIVLYLTTTNLQTLETQPTPIQNFEVISETQALNISWSPPKLADLCVVEYRIAGWINENSGQLFYKQTNETTIYVTDLYACQTYTVQIIPVSNNNDGEPTILEVETNAKVAMASNIQALAQYPNALELSAVDSNFDNKCETIIARFMCEESKPGNATYKVAKQYVEGQVKGVTFKALLAPLSPYTSYRCGIALFNVAGWSTAEETILSTLPYHPSSPDNILLKSRTNASLQFEWSLPQYSNGVIKLYISYFQYVGPAYFVPSRCSFTSTEAIPRETASLQQTFQSLLAYSSYSIQVAAQNEYGVGYFSRPLVVQTAPWISDAVEHLNASVSGPYPIESKYEALVVLTWQIPCNTNGEIDNFHLYIFGYREDQPRHVFNRSVLPVYDDTGLVTYEETDLKPDFDYTVEVSVNVKNVSQSSISKSTHFKAPSAIPQKLDDSQIHEVKVDAFTSRNPTKTAEVRFPVEMLKTNLGTITYVALLLSEKGCNPAPVLLFDALNTPESWPNVMSWSEAYSNSDNKKHCIPQYQATEVRWNPLLGLTDNDSHIMYIIGNKDCAKNPPEACSNVNECSTEKIYCDGPLKPATEYYLVIRFFTRSGYNDVALLEFVTDSVFQLTIIIISICGCLFMSLTAGILYIWISRRLFWQQDTCREIEDSLGDVAAKTFAFYYKLLSKPEKILREFKELALVAVDLSYSASETGCNKNRYTDILPYDKNRVLLDIDDEGSDYINASFIDGYKIKKEYIATQGPKSETTVDFWRMVLHYNVRMVVMLTQFQEGANVKCHEYFPYKSKGISVIIKKKMCYEYYDRTQMMITHDRYGLKRKIEHFYYKKWPDHGSPSNPMNLINFIRKIRSFRLSSYSPIIVHCSAGVGRTGTYIALDILMQRLKHELKINIYETVKKLRFQRMKMVQTLDQYTFLYAAAFELVRHKMNNSHLEENYLKGSLANPPNYLTETLDIGQIESEKH
ncbi:phosphatidylinositol phosphatase PTPRQ isoform X3 [Ceratitis capitata]|uniref:phosphatidylinositol phosphatase PTPRQ isoform X3 n=1 Tax=Ceratitis capitata TaxID=7213 RepID=UPI000618898B|nr:phosphatidylinositol phosphatase PTPRQ isoform X3 [Ceratitis capitata]